MFACRLNSSYVELQDGEIINFDYYMNGCLVNQEMAYNLDSGSWYRWTKHCESGLLVKHPEGAVFSVDAYFNSKRMREVKVQNLPTATPTVEVLIRQLARSDVDGEHILKALKARGVDIKGWKLTRNYLGGYVVSRDNLGMNTTALIDYVSAKESETPIS